MSTPERRGATPSGERGSAVAEFALALPAVVLVLAAVLGGVQAGATAVRLQDAAADAARALARGDPAGAVAAGVATRVPGARLDSRVEGALVCARISVAAGGVPGLVGLRLDASSCALDGGL